jgi:tRNA acetyltransferase TAN1
MDLLVSYSWNHFFPARQEIARVLERFGDPSPQVEKTGVRGIALVHTTLDNREVVRRCRELHEKEAAFEFAVKWVPVDFWCDTSLDAMRKTVEEQIRDRIKEDETWAMVVEKRRWQEHHTAEIVEHLAAAIERKVNLSHPDRIVRVDVFGKRTAISLVTPEDIFSIRAPRPS